MRQLPRQLRLPVNLKRSCFKLFDAIESSCSVRSTGDVYIANSTTRVTLKPNVKCMAARGICLDGYRQPDRRLLTMATNRFRCFAVQVSMPVIAIQSSRHFRAHKDRNP